MNAVNTQNGLLLNAAMLQAPSAQYLPTAIQSFSAQPLANMSQSGGYASAPSAYVDPFSASSPSAYTAPDATAAPTPLASGNDVTTDKSMAPYTQYLVSKDTARPEGDNRTAEEIINDNPVLKNLGNQSGIRDKLNEFVGGNMLEDADQAFRAAALLTNIKSLTQADGQPRSSELRGNGKIDGFTEDGEARHGTEAGVLQDVTKNGIEYLGQLNGRLPTTEDEQVRNDGTNVDNLEHIMSNFISPIVGSIGSIAGIFPNPAAQAVSAGLGAVGSAIDGATAIANNTATPMSLIQTGSEMLQQTQEAYQNFRPGKPASIATDGSPSSTPAGDGTTTSPAPNLTQNPNSTTASAAPVSTGPTAVAPAHPHDTLPVATLPMSSNTSTPPSQEVTTASPSLTSPVALRYY